MPKYDAMDFGTSRPNRATSAREQQRTALWAAGQVLDHRPDLTREQQRHELAELLRELGLLHDPMALDRDTLTGTPRQRQEQP